MKIFATAVAASLLATSTAMAADLPQMQAPAMTPPAAAPQTYDWTGFYVGIFGGAATGDFKYPVSYSNPPDSGDGSLKFTGGGMFGGAQVGADIMLQDQFVLGAYADIAATDIKAKVSGNIDVSGGPSGSASISSELTWLGTIQGRAGYAMDRALFYAHGGAAFGHTEQKIKYNIGGGGDTIDLASSDKTGYVIGAGIEYALTDTVSLKTEYSYYDLGKDTLYSGNDVFSGGDSLKISEDISFQAVTAGVNVRF